MEYPPRVYHLNLQTIGLAVGAFLVVTHLIALLRPDDTRAFLRRFPRSRPWGTVLIAVAAVWSFWLASNLDLGEFSAYRRVLQVIVPALTTVHIGLRDLGRAGVRKLLAQLRQEQVPFLEVLPTTVVERETTAPPPRFMKSNDIQSETVPTAS